MSVPGLRNKYHSAGGFNSRGISQPGGHKCEVKVGGVGAFRGCEGESILGLSLSFWCFTNNLQHPRLPRHCESICVQIPRFRRTIRGDLEPPYSSLPLANYLCNRLIPKFGHIRRCWGLEREHLNFSGEVSFQPTTPGDTGSGPSARELALSTTRDYGLGRDPASSVAGRRPRTTWYVDGQARPRPVA